MRTLIIILIIAGFLLTMHSAMAANFRWSVGRPAVIDNDTTTTKYYWSTGRPFVMYQYQAPVVTTAGFKETLIIFE